MADIQERIIAPYNPPDQRVIQKTEYTMFVPLGTDVNPGILGYDPTTFTTKDGVLYLSKSYRAKIERAIALGDWLPEQVKALELSISLAVGTKFAVTPSTSDVTVADKYLFLSEVGVLISEIPVESEERVYTFEYENASWYLVYDGLRRELESLAAIGLSVTPADYASTFTVTTAYAAVGENDIGYQANALYYSDQAAGSAYAAAGSATDAQDAADDAAGANANAQIAAQNATAEALKSEGYAVGTQNGASVDTESSYYHNNSKYYSDQARYAEAGARVSEDNAQRYKQDAADSADAAYTFAGEARDARDQARSARDQARAARDEVLGALGDGVEVDPIPNTVPKRDVNGKLFAASPSANDGDNVVATKGFVNSSISTNTANFLGTYTYTGTDSHSAIAAWIPSQLPAGTILTNNDYVFVQLTVNGNTKYERYKYNSNGAAWGYEYELNNSSFTAAQWAAINSGITSQDIAAIQASLQTIDETLGQHQDDLDSLAQDIDTLQSGKQDVIDTNHKLASDLVDDTNQTHKFVSATEKATWNAKQDALTAGRNISLAGNFADFNVPFVVLSASAGDTIDVANGTVTLSSDHSAVFANNDFVRVQCNDLLTAGDTYVFQRTYNEPAANNEKIEYFEYVDVGFYGNPLATKAHTYTFFYTTGTTPITLGFIDHTAEGGGSFEYFTNAEIDTAMFGTYTVTGSITNGTSTSATIIARTSATATIAITPNSGYELPASVTVTNATLTSYDDTTGIVTVSNPSGNVTVTAVCEGITYTITTTVTNGIYSGATSISYGGTATVTITPNSTYSLPSSITVSGASYTYDSATGVVSLSNPTGAVSITAVCESAQTMPVKGQIITMTLGNAAPAAGMRDTYRVLKIDGSIAEVVAMFDQSTSQTFGSNNTYAGSGLDTYLITWYNNLSADAKAAIVAKNVQQYQYTYTSSVYNATTHASYADYSTKATKGSAVSKYVYALDVEDIETYFGGTFSTADIWTLFWNTASSPGTPTYPWLRSAGAGFSSFAFYVRGGYGYVGYDDVGNGLAARPAFTIDLSKIEWSKV